MAPRFGSKQDEYNFFCKAFKLIDEHRTDSLINSIRALFFEIFLDGRCTQCFPAYQKLASRAKDGLLIENWNEIPLWRVRKKGFSGYQEALEEIFDRLSNVYKNSLSEQTRRRVEQLVKQAVAILKKRICQVERGGLVADARGTGNHLNVIEMWARCLKVAMEEISYDQEMQVSEEEPDDDVEVQPLLN